MVRNLKYKFAIIAAVVGLSLWLCLPLEKKINLGLDLKGGLDVTYRVDTDVLLEKVLEQNAAAIREKFRNEDISGFLVRVGDEQDTVIIRMPESSDEPEREKLRALAEEMAPQLNRLSGGRGSLEYTYGLPESIIDQLEKDATDKALEIVRNRADEFGVAEPIISKRGAKEIRVQIAGRSDRAQDILQKIDQAAMLTFHLVAEDNDGRPLIAESISEKTRLSGFDESMCKLVNGVQDPKSKKTPVYVLEKEALLTGDMLVDARMGIDDLGKPTVLLRFSEQGANTFAKVTGNFVDRQLAIVLDDKVQSAPRIEEPIYGGRAQITGHFTDKEANQLSVVLRCGALPAPLVKESAAIVSATLGRDLIRRGIYSIAVGGILVLIYIIGYYKLFGIVADIALVLNILLMLGALSLINATLTLPGIAGILLTIGMAVDANVIIFERIKEELREGKTPRSSIDSGFAKAFVTIFDSNFTTLITAVVLYYFGTGPVKGFAVTLGIGIVISMFTALFVARTIIDSFTSRQNVKTLSI